jgi:hypothetical protein
MQVESKPRLGGAFLLVLRDRGSRRPHQGLQRHLSKGCGCARSPRSGRGASSRPQI